MVRLLDAVMYLQKTTEFYIYINFCLTNWHWEEVTLNKTSKTSAKEYPENIMLTNLPLCRSKLFMNFWLQCKITKQKKQKNSQPSRLYIQNWSILFSDISRVKYEYIQALFWLLGMCLKISCFPGYSVCEIISPFSYSKRKRYYAFRMFFCKSRVNE